MTGEAEGNGYTFFMISCVYIFMKFAFLAQVLRISVEMPFVIQFRMFFWGFGILFLAHSLLKVKAPNSVDEDRLVFSFILVYGFFAGCVVLLRGQAHR
jgi:hypothetical protein